MKNSDTKWVWVPNIRLNDLYFDKPYSKYDEFILDKQQIELEKELFDEDDFEFQDIKRNSFSFYGDEHIFTSAEIISNLYYNEINIIGLTIIELEKILKTDDLIFDEYSCSSNKLGAIFWIENNRIESVSVSIYE